MIHTSPLAGEVGATLRRLDEELGAVSSAVVATTGGGGFHRLFRYPDAPCRTRHGSGVLAGLDLQSDNAFIVAPPSLSGEAEARPPQPPLPGSAAAIMADYNRQHPNQNRSADTDDRVSTLSRLPSDDDRGRAAVTPPVASHPVEPPVQRDPGAAAQGSAGVSLRPPTQASPPPASPSTPLSPTRPSRPSGSGGGSATPPAENSDVMPSARSSRIDVPIIIGGSERFDACTGGGYVVGLDPRGDGFLSVRSGPGGRPYSEIDRLYNGNTVTICAERGPWLGVVYGPRSLDCNTGTPWPTRMPYTGPCKAGWIHSRYVKVTVG